MNYETDDKVEFQNSKRFIDSAPKRSFILFLVYGSLFVESPEHFIH